MAQVRTDVELELAAVRKSARAFIRLQYSLEADRAIARALPELESAFHKAVAMGKPFQLDLPALSRSLV